MKRLHYILAGMLPLMVLTALGLWHIVARIRLLDVELPIGVSSGRISMFCAGALLLLFVGYSAQYGFPFPLVLRELLEQSRRKRTYLMRALYGIAIALTLAFYLVDMQRWRSHPLDMLGTGSELLIVVLIVQTIGIYALMPISVCGIITTEKEKGTLSLLLLTRLGPTTILIEKLFSAVLPFLAFGLIAIPALGIAFAYGGISEATVFNAVWILFWTAMQVAAVAVLCSCFFRSSVAAFFGTYVILAFVYFSMPILSEMGLEFPLAYLFGGVEDEFILFPVYIMATVLDRGSSVSGMVTHTTPIIVQTFLTFLLARLCLTTFAFSPKLNVRKYVLGPIERALRVVVGGLHQLISARARAASRERAVGIVQGADDLTDEAHRVFPDYAGSRPVAWRESRRTLLGNGVYLTLMILVMQLILAFIALCMVVSITANRRRWHVEESAVVTIISFIIFLLLIASRAAGLFSGERSTETLDVLLTTPLTNRELLRQKLRSVRVLCVVLLVPLLTCCWMNVLFSRWLFHGTRYWDGTGQHIEYANARDVMVYLSGWVLHALVYMKIVQWTAVGYGLWLKTQVRATFATILSIGLLVVLPAAFVGFSMMLLNMEVDDSPLFFFSSPAFVLGFNEIHELSYFTHRMEMPDSNVLIMGINLAIYGSLYLILRMVCIRALAPMLGRNDHDAGVTSVEPRPVPEYSPAVESLSS